MTDDIQPAPPNATQHGQEPERKLLGRLPEDRLRFATVVLFAAGSLLMPLGLFAVGYGWYGAASTKYAYDQFPYLLSGGLTGVCLTTIGGSLYFGAWVARGQADQRDTAQRMQQQLDALPERIAQQLAALLVPGGGAGTDLVVAGSSGVLVHRSVCRLVADRDDLHPYPGDATDPGGTDVAPLTPCRVCKPTLP